MEYRISDNDIIIKKQDFELDDTLDCGQAFRWEKTEKGYKGYFYNNYLELEEENDEIIFKNTSEKDFNEIWNEYFDFNTDYSELKKLFSEDETMKKACEYAKGIRLLKQNSWETVCSFIISQNNNIPRIKKIISEMCRHYNGFPTAEALAGETPESINFLKTGFRAKYIIDASEKVASGKINLENIAKMPLEYARKELMTVKGIGFKVADCILLYGMYRTDAFPVDVWIKRAMAEYYPEGFPEYLDKYKGIAQQYLFHYIRTKKV
jgi:N-glycosylase/DNA lyase